MEKKERIKQESGLSYSFVVFIFLRAITLRVLIFQSCSRLQNCSHTYKFVTFFFLTTHFRHRLFTLWLAHTRILQQRLPLLLLHFAYKCLGNKNSFFLMSSGWSIYVYVLVAISNCRLKWERKSNEKILQTLCAHFLFLTTTFSKFFQAHFRPPPHSQRRAQHTMMLLLG
jgi:hypothetical protein